MLTPLVITSVFLLCLSQIFLGLSVWSLGFYSLKYGLEQKDVVAFISKLALFPGVFFENHGYSAFFCAGLRGYIDELLSKDLKNTVLARNAYALVILAVFGVVGYMGLVTQTHDYRVGAVLTLITGLPFLWFSWNFGKKAKELLT